MQITNFWKGKFQEQEESEIVCKVMFTTDVGLWNWFPEKRPGTFEIQLNFEIYFITPNCQLERGWNFR